MNGSIIFLFHLIGFGILFTSLLGGWILERRIRVEKDLSQKLTMGQISFRFGWLTPIASLILLLTGIANFLTLYSGNINLLYTEGWLVAKIILFAFLLINGAFFGPILVRRRTKLLRSISEKSAPDDAEATMKVIHKSIATFYLVQFLLLGCILYLSVAGGGKHPGII